MSRSSSLVPRAAWRSTARVARSSLIAAGCGRSETAEAKAPNRARSHRGRGHRRPRRRRAQTLAISGSLAPQTRVDVRSKVPGRLERVLVTIGDHVVSRPAGRHAGRSRDRHAGRCSRRRGERRERRRSPRPRRRSRTRCWSSNARSNLFERGALPRQRLDAAETAHRSAEAQRDLAQANLAQAARPRAARAKSGATRASHRRSPASSSSGTSTPATWSPLATSPSSRSPTRAS